MLEPVEEVCLSAGISGWKVSWVPLVAERSGGSCFDDVPNRLICQLLGSPRDGQGGEHDGEVRFDRVTLPVEHGPQVRFVHPERLLHAPQVVV